MTRDMAFFHRVIKPGRYLGGEIADGTPQVQTSAREIVWLYPDRYERAICDPAWRRSFFQMRVRESVRVSRMTDYAGDVWKALADTDRPVFTLDGLPDVGRADVIVMWAPDVLTAARIPSIVRRLCARLGSNLPEVGVICDGSWIPRFLTADVDWIGNACDGWLPGDIVRSLADGGSPPATVLSRGAVPSGEAPTMPRGRIELEPFHPVVTPRWIPRVEVDDDCVDVELAQVDGSGTLRPRAIAQVVLDALDALRSTGNDSLRFCGSRIVSAAAMPTVLTELQRRYAMKRVRASWPSTTAAEYHAHWSTYKPHLQRPVMKYRVRKEFETSEVIDAGVRALSAGWHGLTIILEFDSLKELSQLLGPVREVLVGWHFGTRGFADKRPLRVEYSPATVDRWAGPVNLPDEESQQFTSEFRRFKDEVSRIAAAGGYRAEELLARNWLAAAGPEIWGSLSRLDPTECDDPDGPAFDWYQWIRSSLGDARNAGSSFLSVDMRPAMSTEMSDENPAPSTPSAMDAPAEGLFGRRKSRGVSTRRLAGPANTRMRVRWAKGLEWRLYSHLDTVRAIERAIRIAGLAASYSEGFHPRLKLSFGPPLPFGLISEAEYFDLLLEQEFQPADSERLAAGLPRGLHIVQARGVAAGMPALSDIIGEAQYSTLLPLELAAAESRLSEFHERPDVSWQRTGRADKPPVDPRKSLRDVRVRKGEKGTIWELSVSVGGEGSIRPTDWAMLLFGFTHEQVAELIICRTALNIRRGNTVRSPFEVV